jgi:hypothetical protein
MSADRYAGTVECVAPTYAALGLATTEHAVEQRGELDDKYALQAAKLERARINALDEEDEARRHLDGEDAVPPNSRRDRQRANLDKRIARLAAAPLLRAPRIEESARRIEDARMPFTAASIAGVAMIQGPAVERIREILAQLENPLVDLLAADRILLATIGDKFSVPTGSVPPFNGATLVRKLLHGIAARLLPPSLDEARLDATATAASVSAIREIKKG